MSVETMFCSIMEREPDSQFEDHKTFYAAAQADEKSTRQVFLQGLDVQAFPTGIRKEPIRLRLSDEYPDVSLTEYSFSQLLLPIPGVNRRLFEIEKEKAVRACELLNLAKAQSGRNVDMALLQKRGDRIVLRALTSVGFDYCPDASVIGEVDRWLVPNDWHPIRPTINIGDRKPEEFKPSLFRSDRNMLAMYQRGKPVRPDDDDFGGLARGIVLGNSEVGSGRILCMAMSLRAQCCNYMLHGVQNLRKQSAVHKGNSAKKFIHDVFVPMLQQEEEPIDFSVFERAAKAAFVGDGSVTDKNKQDAAKRLEREFKVPKSMTDRIVELAIDPINQKNDSVKDPKLTYFTVSQGVTNEGRDRPYAEDIFEFAAIGERVLVAAR